jgi:hypothetical protein
MRRVFAAVVLSAVTLLASPQASRDSPTTSQSVIISGRVVVDATGDPIRNARVTVSPSGQGTPVVLSDGEGRFSLTAPLGPNRLIARKSGYARSEATWPADGGSLPEIRLR